MKRKRKAIVDGVKNIFWALVFAVALWFVMAQSEQTTKEVQATLTVVPPQGANVTYHNTQRNQPPTISIQVVGLRQDLERLDGIVSATNTIPEGTLMGPRSLFARDFQFNLERGVQVDTSSLTQEIKIELAPVKMDELVVEPNLDIRDIPDGWEIKSQTVDPKIVPAKGSAEDMARNPKLTTEPLSLLKMLERNEFDKTSNQEKEVEQRVQVIPPEGTGIHVLARGPVTVRVRLKPKDLEREIPLVPAYRFLGPIFQGLPYKLRPALPQQEVVKVRVSGPDLALRDSQIEATKAKFIVFAEMRPEELGARWKPEVGKYYTFQVHVIPPPDSGIRVLSYDDNIKISVEPMQVEPTPGVPK